LSASARRSRTVAIALTACLAATLIRLPDGRANLASLPPPVERQERLGLADRELTYQVAAGFIPLAADRPTETTLLYYTAYTRKQEADAPPRPIAIAFNGGPGASSLYLHLLGLAPQRLDLDASGRLPEGPPQLVANPDTWLEFADLVFVDPPGTGYSPIGRPSQAERHFDLYGDAQAMGEFIQRYLQQIGRPDAPVYLVGESYGGTRAVLLAAEQVESFDLRGLILISPVLDYQFLDPRASGNLKLALTLPTLAATARYHDQLSVPPARGGDLWLEQVEAWAIRSYLPALVEGDRLPDNQRRAIARQLERYTGLPRQRFLDRQLRLTTGHFSRYLLSGRRLDPWDSRFAYTTIPPSEQLDQAMVEAWSDYAARTFGLDGEYVLFSHWVNQRWRWDNQPFNLDLAPQLGDLLRRQSELQLFVAVGYYDLVVPFAAVRYSLNRLGLPPEGSDRVQLSYYAAGHMVYLPARERQHLRAEVAALMQAGQTAVGDRPQPFAQPFGR